MSLIGQKNSYPISTWLLYITACFAFFSGWFFVAADYEWLRQNFSWLMRLNTPVTDLAGAVMVAVFVLALVKKFITTPVKFNSWKEVQKSIPGELKWYLLFVCSAAVSIYFIYDHAYTSSAWHWLRYIVFSYVAFLVVPYFLLDKEKVLKNILHIWFGVGLFTVIYGLASLLVHDVFTQWTRVSPFPIYGWEPFGVNQNQLAEALVVILPIAVYFTIEAYKEKKRSFNFYFVASAAMVLVCLLIFSRAAWIALGLQGIIAIIFAQKRLMVWGANNRSYIFAALLAGAVISGCMLYFLTTSHAVKSSNSARWETTQIVFYNIKDAPFFGFGPGAYMKILWNTKSYVMDFGDPLEAHGFIQKVLIEEGFVGFAFFVLFLITYFLHLWNAQRESGDGQFLARVLFLSVLGIVAFQLFNTEYFSAVMWLPMGVALAHARLRV